jgi:hypothetical protein
MRAERTRFPHDDARIADTTSAEYSDRSDL